MCVRIEFGARETTGKAGFGGGNVDAVRGVGGAAILMDRQFIVTLVLTGSPLAIVAGDGRVLLRKIVGHLLAGKRPVGSGFRLTASAAKAVGVAAATATANTAVMIVGFEVDGTEGGSLVAFGEPGMVVAEAAFSGNADQIIEAFVTTGHTMLGVALTDISNDVAGSRVVTDADAIAVIFRKRFATFVLKAFQAATADVGSLFFVAAQRTALAASTAVVLIAELDATAVAQLLIGLAAIVDDISLPLILEDSATGG